MRPLIAAALISTTIVPGTLAAQQTVTGERPLSVQRLGLADIEFHPKKREHYGRLVYGTSPDGTRVQIDIGLQGNVEEVEAKGRAIFAARTVNSLIPKVVLSNPSYPADAAFFKLELDDPDRIEIEGRHPGGRRFEAEFRADGRLIELKNDD